jgi:hypothetical protein
MLKMLIPAALVLAGCAQIPREQRAAAASNYELCRGVFLAPPNVAQVARNEAIRRGLDCAPMASAILQNEAQADAARSALAIQLMNANRVAPPPMIQHQPQMNCRTYTLGNSLHTSCN